METITSNFQNFDKPEKPDNYLIWAILSTLLCCLPLGVVSIIKSTQVNSKYENGDYEGAQKASEEAKKFAKYSAIVGVVVGGISFIISIGGALLSEL